jgi:hypothetical protein
MTSAPLHVDMDALKIGPAGQTLGELKQALLDARADFVTSAQRGEPDDGRAQRVSDAVSLLRAAYVRLGLPYKTP